MARAAATIQAEIETLEADLTKLASPTRLESVKNGEREMKFGRGVDTELTIRRRLRELKAELARVCGTRSPAAPVRV